MHSSPAPMRKVPKAQNPYHADDGLDIPMEGPLLPTSVRLGGGGKAAVIERIELSIGFMTPRSPVSLRCRTSTSSPRCGRMHLEPIFPNLLHTYLPRKPEAPKIVAVMPDTPERVPEISVTSSVASPTSPPASSSKVAMKASMQKATAMLRQMSGPKA